MLEDSATFQLASVVAVWGARRLVVALSPEQPLVALLWPSQQLKGKQQGEG